MKLTGTNLLLALSFSLLAAPVPAAELQEMGPDRARQVAELLVAAAGKISSPQVTIEADVAKASGLRIGRDGVIIVPQKGLNETDEGAPVDTDPGASLAYLFLSEAFCPVVNGKPVEEDKLRIANVTDRQGGSRAVKCFLLAVRQRAEDDWRLYVYGADKKPLVTPQFAESSQKRPGPIALGVRDVSGTQGTLTVTVFGKYEAGFGVAYSGT